MEKNWFFILILLGTIFGSQQAFASEIIANPLKDPFGPNDWIEIDLEIDGYLGGIVKWNATRPDGSLDSGELSSFKSAKKLHSIIRDAFDNQFGTWSITYIYNGVNKTISAVVEPLIVEVSTDKEAYYPGDIGTAFFKTNYYEPIASEAESYRIEIVNSKGEPALHTDFTYVKAYQAVTIHKFSVNDLVKYNPAGTYKAIVKYYNTITEHPFYLGDAVEFVSIFLGTDKSSYSPDDVVDLNIVVSKVLNTNPTLKIISPSGEITTKTFPINSKSTHIILDDISISEPGNYKITFEYGGFQNTGEFFVEDTDNKFDSKGNLTIPDWVRNIASWWSNDQIPDDDFASGIEYMIEQSIIVIPNLGESGEVTEQKIPSWVKNNAKWWSEGQISDVDFASGIEFLVKNGIIQV